ncbi:RNA polymerase sigma factor [Kitasatospora sp. LaBMicrA B282]|uniref:RNA polymerase sigma factor n=1 Tax=Kitasatospora sp. LaBMicrA B282 TaxID=3420949 RepID=UPI003D0ADE60
MLVRAQAGDRQALNDLIAHIAPYVSRVCTPIARRHGPDAAQEALFAVYRGVHGLRDTGAFYGWVRAIAVREAVRAVKLSAPAGEDVLPEVTQDANPLDVVHIDDILHRLSRQHRQVLALRVLGLPEEEIARLLQLPVGTVRSRLHRARRSFRAHWEAQPVC